MPAWFVQFFFWSFCGREVCGLGNGGGSVFKGYWNFSLKVGRSIKIAFFLKNSSIYSKSCSGHMECSFGNFANFVVPETQNILAHCPKVRNVLFLPEFRPLECSTGRVECLTDEPWVFFANQIFLRTTIKRHKVVSSSEKVLPKGSSGHVDFVFDTLVENFCHKSGISSFKIRKESQTYFFGKNPFVSKFFSAEHMECVVNNSAKSISPAKHLFFAHCP